MTIGVGEFEVAPVAHAIQLSVAPVFLLSGVGVFLGVLTNRLARIVDRARPLEEQLHASNEHDRHDLRQRLTALAQRAHCIHLAITLATVAALLVAMVVAVLFVSAFVSFNLSLPVAILFVGSMLSLVGALVAFLVEVQIAIRTVQIFRER
jgi:Protein of unknown function (DUF2721)